MKPLINKVLIGTFIATFIWFIHSLYGWIGVGIFFGMLIGLPWLFLLLGILFVIIYAKLESKTFRTDS
jgi:hypothetical protein